MSSDDLRAIIAQAAEEAAEKVYDRMISCPPVEGVLGTRQEVCDFLKISKPTFHSLANKGAFRITKIGRRTLVDMSDLRAKVESGEISRYKHSR